MDPQVAQLEELCIHFSSVDPAKRKFAHDTLFMLVSDPTSVNQFMRLLAYSQDSQALLFSANALSRLFTSFWTAIDEAKKIETRSFMLTYLYQKGKTLLTQSPETLSALVRLFVRVVKLQYLESPVNQSICDQVQPFLASSTADWVIGIMIYLELTEDMCPQAGKATPARARRQAFAFRDTALSTIFKTAVDTLQRFFSGTITLTANAVEETQLLKAVLQLSLSCLSFDFMGIFPDETNEERSDLLIIPSSWTIIKEARLLQLYFGIYKSCFKNKPDFIKIECGRLCLQALVQLTALRRSYFTKEDDRKNHLTDLIQITSEIITTNYGIKEDTTCYHHFCRLLGKINSSIPFMELKAALMDQTNHHDRSGDDIFDLGGRTMTLRTSSGIVVHYSARGGEGGLGNNSLLADAPNPRDWSARDTPLLNWLKSVRQFTLDGLSRWAYMSNSKHYLMGFWVSLVPILTQKSNKVLPVLIETVHAIFRAFVGSLLKIGEANALFELKATSGENAVNQCMQYSICDVPQLAEATEIEDLLNDEVFRSEQLDVVHHLGKIEYISCLTYLNDSWESTVRVAQDGYLPKIVSEQRLILMIYLFGALMSGQTPVKAMFSSLFGGQSSSDTEASSGGDIADSMEKDAENAKLSQPELMTRAVSTNIFKLMTGRIAIFDPASVSEIYREALDFSFLYFMDSFRRTFFGEKPSSATFLHSKGELDEDFLSLMLQKILLNIKSGISTDAVRKKSLDLFHALTSSVLIMSNGIGAGRSSHLLVFGRLILKTQVIQSLLTPQGSREIVESLHPIENGSHRTSLYQIIAKLLFLSMTSSSDGADSNIETAMDEGYPTSRKFQPTDFSGFMQPIANIISEVWPAGGPQGGAASGLDPNRLAFDASNPTQRLRVASLFRDLRGICQTCVVPQTYDLFFDWMVNRPKKSDYSRLHLMSVALKIFWDDYPVAIAILRFAAEITSMGPNRIVFKPSSPSGIILFREVSQVLSTYAPQILAKDVRLSRNIYKEKYKGLALTLTIFSNSLAGDFANLGAFQAYGDQALPDALRLGLQICLAFPEEDLQAYTKLLIPYYTFLELMTRSHMTTLLELDPPMLARIVRTLEDGMCFSTKARISLLSSTALTNLTGHFITRLTFESSPASSDGNLECYPKSEEDMELWRAEAARIKLFLAAEPSSLKRVIQLAFQLIMTDQSASTWSLSGVILGLIILNYDEYQLIKEAIIVQQIGDQRKGLMRQYFEGLLEGLDLSLSKSSKERFTRNLYNFVQLTRSNIFGTGNGMTINSGGRDAG